MLPGCLESARDSVDEMIVVDTGSTDDTVAIAKELGAKVISIAWTDFSTARNESLKAASCEWALVLDADEELAVEEPDTLRRLADSGEGEAYAFTVINCQEVSEYIDVEGSPQFASTKFFRRQGVSYINPIHERVIFTDDRRTVFIPGILIVHYGYLKDIYHERGKFDRNSRAIRDWQCADPQDPWANFYLARDVLLKEERYLEAIEALKAAYPLLIEIGITQLSADVLMHLVLCYEELGETDNVVETFARGIVVFPDYVELRYYYGCFLFNNERFKEAIEQLQQCFSLNENDHRYYVTVRGSSTWRPLQVLSDAFLKLGEAEMAIIARTMADRLTDRAPSLTAAPDAAPLSSRGRELLGMIETQGPTVMVEVADFLKQHSS